MAPNYARHCSAAAAAAVATAHLMKKGNEEFGAAVSIDVANVDDSDDKGDENDLADAATIMHRIYIRRSNSFMDEYDKDDGSCIIQDAITNVDVKSSALMTSFDVEDIDLISSPHHPLHHCTSAGSLVIILSTDEDLARQLQAEEDESAQEHSDALIFRKTQKQHTTRTSSTPLFKVKKSWLDILIGEPFPEEVMMNYARSDSQNSNRSNATAAEVTTPTISSSYPARLLPRMVVDTPLSHFSNLLRDSCRHQHETHITRIPVWCLAAF